jgi:cysteinyl-tRNA synthetase
MPAPDSGLRLYNTLTRTTEAFAPIDSANVRMYVCGPTVYDFAHIGNARPVIVFDVLYRLLRHVYGAAHVTYVRNITDVDDKINARAARDFPNLPLNEAIARVTEATNAQFQADVKALGCLEPDDQPRATAHIDGMKAMIERLVAQGVAYVAEGHVLFSPSAMNARPGPRYGALSRRPLDEMLAGARVDVASYKRDEMDFVLWKPSKAGEPGWPSPAGIEGLGRPGWHIECSAMSMAKLLEPFGGGLSCDDPEKNVFDIHGGGIDLVFPHHENEIAQSCCALGTERMARVWMHNGFLQVEGRKMSKSEGNFVTIHELLATEKFGGRKWPGEVLRLAMLMTHYREPIDFSVRKLEEAAALIAKWRRRAAGAKEGAVDPAFVAALGDDLDMAEYLRLMNSSDLDPSALMAAAALIGLDLSELETDIDVAAFVAKRLAFIAQKNWAEADRIRDELLEKGVQLKDGKDPATGERVTTWEVKR